MGCVVFTQRGFCHGKDCFLSQKFNFVNLFSTKQEGGKAFDVDNFMYGVTYFVMMKQKKETRGSKSTENE